MFFVDKLYDHTNGWSACFRQPEADSHCHDPHGYPLAFRLRFAAKILDRNNWVLDFGGLKPVKAWLGDTFDHRTILAAGDPALEDFCALYKKWRFKPPLVIPFVGCEGFAHYVFQHVNDWLHDNYAHDIEMRCLALKSVTVAEHAGNSATFEV